MATLPSAKDTAQEILKIFVEHFKCRPSHVLRVNNFLAIWHKRGLVAEDFDSGMEFAAQEGWVVIRPDGNSFELTQSGYSMAPEKNDDKTTPPTIVNNNIVNIESAVNSPVMQGINSTQKQNISFESLTNNDIAEFSKLLNENLSDLNLSLSDENKVKAQLATIDAQLLDEPNPIILKEAGKTIRTVIEGALGAIIATSTQHGVWQTVAAVSSCF